MKIQTSRRDFLKSSALSTLFAAIPGWAKNHGCERRFFNDPETGVRIMQATSFPTVNMNLYFHSRCWTPDAGIFLFWSMTQPKRGGLFDLYRIKVDGTELVQMTDGKSLSNVALCPDGGLVYFTSGDGVYTIDLMSLKETQVATMQNGIATGGIGSFTDDGRRYCFDIQRKDGKPGIAWLDTSTRRVHIIPKAFNYISHLQIEPGQGRLFHYIGEKNSQGYSLFAIDEEGREELAFPIRDENGHEAWLGPSGKLYSALREATRAILVAAPGDSRPSLLAAGPPNFWHPGCDPAGQWIVSDSSNPDDGLHLLCVATGRLCRLARSGSDNGHAQWTHPHPSVSPGAKYVLFNSTRTGVPHVYIAEIPSAMKEKLQIPFQEHSS